MRSLMPFVGAVAMAYGGLCAWAFLTQRGQIYFPTPESQHALAQVLWLAVDGERVKVWAVTRPGPKALLYFGGNAEDVAGNIELFAESFADRSLLLVNYRGYGGSSGRPSETALVADAIAVFDRVRRDHSEIAVMGRSLGSGIAVQLAAVRPVERLVLVTAYDSLVNVARTYFRWLPVGLLLRDRYESSRRASAVTAPVLIVVAAEDEIIPRARSEALVGAFAPGQVEVVVVPGAGHNTLDLSPRYMRSVAEFLAESRAGADVRRRGTT
ncbi:MAG TPA: alpha/beta fold hydrolase [Steroidobacteraceae bacterium]|nr:alpha/beta fold hydrolase [Steroidobacteraceae bacterium]